MAECCCGLTPGRNVSQLLVHPRSTCSGMVPPTGGWASVYQLAPQTYSQASVIYSSSVEASPSRVMYVIRGGVMYLQTYTISFSF